MSATRLLGSCAWRRRPPSREPMMSTSMVSSPATTRSEEHTSELQSQSNLVCRLLLEKKNNEIKKLIIQNDKLFMKDFRGKPDRAFELIADYLKAVRTVMERICGTNDTYKMTRSVLLT